MVCGPTLNQTTQFFVTFCLGCSLYVGLSTTAKAQSCGQVPDVITAPSGKSGSHGCDSDRDGTVKNAKYCRCDDCSIHPNRCHRKGDDAFCSCDPALQHCQPRACINTGGCSPDDPQSYYWAIDCNDYSASRFPGNCEICGNSVDENCNGTSADCEGQSDADNDGSWTPQDCNDNNPNIHPGAIETPCNAVDEDCNGTDRCEASDIDADNDGFVQTIDCNDNDAAVHPGALDMCNDGVNADCDPLELDCADDADGDNYGIDSDCNDLDPSIFPGAFDLCGDGIDQDCSGHDAACILDQDRDGYDDISIGGTHCNDLNSSIYPNALENCGDGIDQSCNGVDVDCNNFDADGDGFAALDTGGEDCDDSDDSVYPNAPEQCGVGIDANCDGITGITCALDSDLDGDGFQSTMFGGADCHDRDSRINPFAPENCQDDQDNNCDGIVNDGCAQSEISSNNQSYVNVHSENCSSIPITNLVFYLSGFLCLHLRLRTKRKKA